MKRSVLINAILILLALPCGGEEVVMEEVVITATKTKRPQEEVSASISVIPREEITLRGIENLDEALKREVGCNTKRGKGLADTHARVTLRGFEGQKRTLVMIDGNPLNDPYYGSVPWSSIPVEDVERVEIVRGPFSSLYGGNAMGGAINIITRVPEERELTLKTSYGTYETYTYHLSYRDRVGILGMSIGYHKKHTQGYVGDFLIEKAKDGEKGVKVTGWERTKDPCGNTRYLLGDKGKNGAEDEAFSSKFTLNLREDSTLSLGVISSRYRYWYKPGASYLEGIAGERIDEGYVWIEDDGEKRYFKIYPGSFLKGKGRMVTNIYTIGYDGGGSVGFNIRGAFIENPEDWYIRPSKTDATRDGGKGKLTNIPSRSLSLDLYLDIEDELIIGGGYRGEWAECKEWDLSDWLDEESKTRKLYVAGGRTSTYSFYIQDELEIIENPNGRLSLLLGARYDFWQTYDGKSEELSASSPVGRDYEDRQKDSLSPKASLVYHHHPASTTLRLSCGRAFRPPTIYELYRTWSIGTKTYMSNPDLRPEETTSWEAGITQSLFKNRLRMSITYFENYIKDLIYRITDEDDPDIKRLVNAARAKTKGIELEVDHRFNEYLSIFGGFTYMDPKITENPDLPHTIGKQVTYTASQIHSFGIRLDGEILKGEISGQYIGKRYTKDDNSDTEEGVYGSYDSRFVMDTNWRVEVARELLVSFGIENIFDRQYYEHSKAPGRIYTLGVEARF